MKIMCLGGAGRICRETVHDLVEFTDAERITIADISESEARRLAAAIGRPHVDHRVVDVTDHNAAVACMRGYDIVADGTTIALNGRSTACIAAAGCHGINLNGFGEEYRFDAEFKAHGRVHVPGFGMTPGITDMMVRHAADQMAHVDTVRVSHGAFRPIAFSPAITATTTYEYDPALPDRVVYEDGRFIQVPPFARQRDIALPEPYGTLPQWIIPHAETRTVHAYLKDKGIRLIEVRGTWPPENMQLIKTLFDWGFLNNETVRVNDAVVPVMDAIAAFLQQSPKGRTTALYGYALHVQVIGTRDGRWVEHVLTHTHPPSDGSVAGWEGLRAYTRNVGIPMAVGAGLIASGRVSGIGVTMPEFAFTPRDVFALLAKRGIEVHEKIRFTTPPQRGDPSDA